MGKKSSASRGIGSLIVNIAIACYLFTTGVIAFNDDKWRNFLGENEIRTIVREVFGRGDFSDALVAVLAVIAIAAGVLILLKLFSVNIPILETILLVLAIVWAAFVILNVIYLIKEEPNFLSWLKLVSTHLIVLGGIIVASGKFGD